MGKTCSRIYRLRESRAEVIEHRETAFAKVETMEKGKVKALFSRGARDEQRRKNRTNGFHVGKRVF